MKDWELRDLIFDSVFEALRLFVERGGLDNRDWSESPESIAAEFELNQCYAWYTKVWPIQTVEVDSFEKWEELLEDEQKMLERLIRVREWL
jgi:hypothetical protein